MLDVIQLKQTIDLIGEDSYGVKIPVKVSSKTALRSIVTIHEVVNCWRISERQVRRLCEYGVLTAEKSGGTWLIVTQSVYNRWGKPIINLEDYRNVK